jgi:hypothetical protein
MRSSIALSVLVACTSSEPAKSPPSTERPVPVKTEVEEAKAHDAAEPTNEAALPPLQVFHAVERRGKLDVEIVVDLLDERDQKRLAKLAKGEIEQRTPLSVAPGDTKLPASMRATELTIVTRDGVATAKVTAVLAGGGPSGPHGILAIDRAAKKGEHAIALVGAAKNPAARLEAVATAPLGAGDPMRPAAIEAAKSALGLEIDAKAWARARVLEVTGVRKPVLGGVYLFNLELEDGGAHALFGNTKDGRAQPLLAPSPEGNLALLGRCDLDGDGADEILAQLDAFEGRYIVLLRWDESESAYASTTIAGDGT